MAKDLKRRLSTVEKKLNATENKAKDVETKFHPIYRIPEGLLQAVLNYLANSVPRANTVQEIVNLANALQKLQKVE